MGTQVLTAIFFGSLAVTSCIVGLCITPAFSNDDSSEREPLFDSEDEEPLPKYEPRPGEYPRQPEEEDDEENFFRDVLPPSRARRKAREAQRNTSRRAPPSETSGMTRLSLPTTNNDQCAIQIPEASSPSQPSQDPESTSSPGPRGAENIDPSQQPTRLNPALPLQSHHAQNQRRHVPLQPWIDAHRALQMPPPSYEDVITDAGSAPSSPPPVRSHSLGSGGGASSSGVS